MSKKVIIIGGGVGGLSAGIYSQINGYDTEIVEMHTKPGGQCTAWERKGYRFDYCVHWLVGTAKGPFYEVWNETDALNKDVVIVNHEISIKFFNGNGEEFIVYTDINQWEEYLLKIAPEDSSAIKKMCAEMRKGVRVEAFINPPELRKMADYLHMIRMFPLMGLWMKYGKKNCIEYFDRLNITNPLFRSFFHTFYGTQDFSAIAFLMMFAWNQQKNCGYPIGGSLPLTSRMAERFRSLGGKLTLGKKVEKILVENNQAVGVKLADGTIIKADYIVSAADGHSTLYDMLEGKYLTKQIEHAYSSWKLFSPFIQIALGIDTIYETDCVTQFYLAKALKIGHTELTTGYSIMNYAFDPTMAPPGKSVMIMRFDSSWDVWENMNDEEYQAEKETIKTTALELLKKVYPDIIPHIEVTDVATPKTSVRYTGVWKGAYEGFLPTSKNMGTNLKMTLPGLDNFYMAGQWLFPGGGLPPSGQSGKWVVQLMCDKDRKKFQTTDKL